MFKKELFIKKVLITGGSRGIGAAMVRAFHRSGLYHVTFTYNQNRDKALGLIEELGGGLGLKAVPLNLNDKTSIRSLMEELVSEQEGYDVVVHNAASTADQAFYFLEEDQWSDVIQASLNSFFYINKALLPHMIQKRSGRIIVMGSISGEAGQRGQSNYAAAKGALIAASKSLAKEVARKGILVNAVSPGLIETDMTKGLLLQDVLPLIPIGRLGKADEVAKVVLFLASDDASYINGTVIQVNGGLYT
ncbi:MAG: 3-oxoacyl-ACP reductase FabG [Chitinophagaceae bacterium]|nr:3-oxoacyl-ACP reductase FabG [Oligoflexus sp.]